jgi:exodeoxyribonuclease V alpha subunit
MTTAPAVPPERKMIVGTVKSVKFTNRENGFHIVNIKTDGVQTHVTVTGPATWPISVGHCIEAHGRETVHKTHGPRFEADLILPAPGNLLDQVEAYMSNAKLPGIDKEMAAQLRRAFGDRLLTVIEKEPAKLAGVARIDLPRAVAIQQAWLAKEATAKNMIFFMGVGLSANQASKAVTAYGADAEAAIRKNPYRLAKDIHGIGFAQADSIAVGLGLPPDHQGRISTGIIHMLDKMSADGHCAAETESLIVNTARLLDLDRRKIRDVLDILAKRQAVVALTLNQRDHIASTRLDSAERRVADRITQMLKMATPNIASRVDEAIDQAIRELNLPYPLTAPQRLAIRNVFTNRISVITGGPGTGKTTICRAIVHIAKSKKIVTQLAALAGLAARRLTEATGHPASTIHSMLLDTSCTPPRFRDASNPLSAGMLILDEGSTLDILLLAQALDALPANARLVLIGDHNQIASIGPGCALADIIASGRVTVTRLNKIHRQENAGESDIIRNADRILRGECPETDTPYHPNRDYYFVPAATPEEMTQTTLEILTQRLQKLGQFDPVRDVQVLSPSNKGPIGTHLLNTALRRALIPGALQQLEQHGSATDANRSCSVFGYLPGDKIMYTDNDDQIGLVNGDIGYVIAADEKTGDVVADFGRANPTRIPAANLINTQLANAMSFHKTIGSEYPAVILEVSRVNAFMLNRQLLFTGLTRGKKLSIIVGSEQALHTAARRVAPPRITQLLSLLKSQNPPLRATGPHIEAA